MFNNTRYFIIEGFLLPDMRSFSFSCVSCPFPTRRRINQLLIDNDTSLDNHTSFVITLMKEITKKEYDIWTYNE